jgi:hypothetical protein
MFIVHQYFKAPNWKNNFLPQRHVLIMMSA